MTGTSGPDAHPSRPEDTVWGSPAPQALPAHSPGPCSPAPYYPGPYSPDPEEVERLIQRAREHPLGTDFLRDGALDAVSSVFGVHAFVVDSAREVMGDPDPAL